MTDTAQKLKISDIQIDGLKKSKIHTELTIGELKVCLVTKTIQYIFTVIKIVSFYFYHCVSEFTS